MRYNSLTSMHKHKPLKRIAKKRQNPLLSALKFLPAVVFFSLSAGFHHIPIAYHSAASHSNVLSYATSISNSDLLAQTNAQRSGNGVASLSSNGLLTNAAQTKANDMVARNYWSHTTPDGEEPWVFITNAGYQYQTAGENLAYGFATSADTVTGWMNSPPHRENLLNGSFREVGFGFANSANYVGDGPETVVVAMYAAPLEQAPVAAVNNPPSTPSVQSKATPANTAPSPSSSQPQAIQTPSSSEPVAEPTKTKDTQVKTSAAAKSGGPKTPTAITASVRRIQLLTGGNARWSSTLLVASIFGVGIFWVLERGRQIKHLVLAGEHYILKHIHIDLAVIGFITLGFSLLQTSGLVR